MIFLLFKCIYTKNLNISRICTNSKVKICTKVFLFSFSKVLNTHHWSRPLVTDKIYENH